MESTGSRFSDRLFVGQVGIAGLRPHRLIAPILALGLSAIPLAGAWAGPCETILCLGGLLEGSNGGSACNALTADYFAIQVWSPMFNPPATASARRAFLQTCPAGPETQPVIAAITATYGPMLHGPTF